MPLLVFTDFSSLLPTQWSSRSIAPNTARRSDFNQELWVTPWEISTWQSLPHHTAWPLSVRRGFVGRSGWFDLGGVFCFFSAIIAVFSGIKHMVNWLICFVSWHTVLSMTCSWESFRSVYLSTCAMALPYKVEMPWPKQYILTQGSTREKPNCPFKQRAKPGIIYDFPDVGRARLWQSSKNWQDKLLIKLSLKSRALLSRPSLKPGSVPLLQSFQVLPQGRKVIFKFCPVAWSIALYLVPASPGQQLIICIGSANYSNNDSANIV